MIAALRALFEMVPSQGAPASCAFDTDEDPLGGGILQLTGLKGVTDQTIILSPTATDEAITFGDSVAVILYSDQPFSVRRAAGETLWTNVQFFTVWGKDTANKVADTSVLLTGNTSNEATIRAITIPLPT